ncbi:chromosome segregation protein SMC [Lactobacillus sp. LL6]|uniref:chromosome segregation protein SMC n=1 Tax=Lactobacillus sp. LL6 TaxID=2596827 RepID=UPI0011849700|nr:chromosome segregation protein SMC [Lactobacillus sp. LL6]TSO26495.1 chromosome segregation protein SMC [Lactobacillus sp. LL6]
MPLTELIIDGFKSFAEKTTIHFDTGITGVVGPNGSGKSNITEAIRWAMGETRAKSLRGSNMKDVIFAGSEFRKPLNRAIVTLIFDNKKHELASNQDKVSITRKILRSGDSEYLINNRPVRLKDVRELFLDSGISQNSLAIISQGRVDQILNSRPEERRVIFEEAAGVLHFKEQKETAARELERTNDNLIRINDLVKELEKRVEPLHEQSSLAKEYKFQKAGLDQKLKTLLAFEIEDLDNKKAEIQKSATKNQVLLSKLDKEVKDSQQAVSEKRQEYQEIQEKREAAQSQLLKLTDEISKLNTNLQVTEQSKQFDEATKNEYKNQVAELTSQISQLNNELADISKTKESLSIEQDELKQKRENLLGQLKDDPAILEQKLEDLRNTYIQLLQDQTTNNNQLVYLESELKKTRDDQSYKNNDVSEQLKTSSEELTALKNRGKQLTIKHDNLEKSLTDLFSKKSDAEDRLRNLRKTVNNERTDLQKITARYEALVNIQKRHEGYYYGVRSILNNLDSYPGVIGAIGELISFSAEYEAAMTTALGSSVQDLVTDSRVSAKNAINKLKQTHAGRATFLPLDGLRQYNIPTSTITTLKSFKGFKGIASQLIKNNSKHDISEAINYLLGSVIVVDNIENALAISRRLGRYRIVTLDGDIISPGGSMTGGMRNQRNNSPLQTTSEINRLKDKSTTLEKQFNSDQKMLQVAIEDSEDLTQKYNQINKELQAVAQELGEVALSYKNQEKEVKRLSDANNLFDSRVKERIGQIKATESQIEEARNRKEELALQADKEKQQMAQIQDSIKNFNSLNQEVQNKLSDLDPKLAVVSNKYENLHNQELEKLQQSKSSQKQLEELKQKLSSLGKNNKLSEQKRLELQKQEKAAVAEKIQLEKKLRTLSSNLGQVDAQITQLDQVATRNYELRKNAATEQEEYSVKIAKFNTEIDQRLTTLSEDYSLTYEGALNQAKLENNAENRADLKKNVKLHRMSLEDIGPVNLNSIEEYEDVKSRYEFLHGQQDDLLKAREDLKQSMNELDIEVKTRFSETFTAASENFTKIFPIVFGGGNAKLVLTEPDNLLKTGIEIIAQPPGKKLQRLSLLSGGERALTAITLLFAMLQINPVPFCVLDEVEAALDDANVSRFAQFLQKYDMHTQFIVITHRRGTMQQADQLYGVVMQESGVSQVLSVSLKDIKDEVE